jgi:uncharacterized glyoxalase superfamily protein PhnB
MSRPAIVPTVVYKDPLAAMRWLERAFGFETTLVVTDAQGVLGHAEMTFRGAAIAIAGEHEGPPFGEAKIRSPQSLGGANTQFLRLNLEEGLDEHFQRARAAGATIADPPQDQFYGARTYRCLDPEGHLWNFSMEVAAPSIEEMERASGLKLSDRLPA